MIISTTTVADADIVISGLNEVVSQKLGSGLLRASSFDDVIRNYAHKIEDWAYITENI